MATIPMDFFIPRMEGQTGLIIKFMSIQLQVFFIQMHLKKTDPESGLFIHQIVILCI